MNYRETLFFIGKCLTLIHEEKYKDEIKEIIENKNVDWDSVVKVSTAHYVFPALYCNLLHGSLLAYIPKDLANYMQHINNLNRERNLEIIMQAKEINNLLLKNNIHPIFLKGTSFLIENLYSNISERMIGDIDFLVSDHQFSETVKILKEYGYFTLIDKKHIATPLRHYPRMIKKNSIAAIEVHNKVILNKYSKNYSYNLFLEGLRKFDNMNVPSVENQILHNCINKQFSDGGRYYKSITLRNSYDLLKLSKKLNPIKVITKYKFHFDIFNTYIGASKLLFKSDSLTFEKNRKSNFDIKIIFFLAEKPFLFKLNTFFINLIKTSNTRLKQTIKFLNNKDFRRYLFNKLKVLIL